MPLEIGDKRKTSDQEDTIKNGTSSGKLVIDKAAQAGSFLKGHSEKGILSTNEKAANERFFSADSGKTADDRHSSREYSNRREKLEQKSNGVSLDTSDHLSTVLNNVDHSNRNKLDSQSGEQILRGSCSETVLQTASTGNRLQRENNAAVLNTQKQTGNKRNITDNSSPETRNALKRSQTLKKEQNKSQRLESGKNGGELNNSSRGVELNSLKRSDSLNGTAAKKGMYQNRHNLNQIETAENKKEYNLHVQKNGQTLQSNGESRLQIENKGKQLYTKKRVALHSSQASRLVTEKSGKDYTGRRAITPDRSTKRVNLNANRMLRTESKLQKSMRKQYRKDYTLKGGVLSPLRVESGMKSRLRTSSLTKMGDKTEKGMESALHFTQNAADQDEFGTQKALFDVTNKGAGVVTGVYKISRQAKEFRLRRREKKIAGLLKKENKLAKKTFHNEYKAAYTAFKNSPVGKESSFLLKQKQRRFLKRKYMKNAMKQYQNAKKAGSAAKVTYNTGFSIADKVKHMLTSAVTFVRESRLWIPIAGIALLLMLPTVLTGIFTVIMAPFMDNETNTVNQVSGGFPAEVESYRELITKLCEEYNDEPEKLNLTEYVNAMLALIQIESGGNGTDPMQASECGYNTEYPRSPNAIKDPEYSCRCGVQYARDAFIKFGVEGSDDFERLAAAVQGYNFGIDGWHSWISERGGKYSVALAQEYSDTKMPANAKGTPTHGQKFLDAYMAAFASTGGGEIVQKKGVDGVINTALNQEGITEDPPGSNTVVFNTEFYGSEVSGDDYPWCCAFVWWCFEKSGNGNLVPKTAGCAYMQSHISEYGGKQLSNLNEAKKGDLVIFRGGQHIGIVVENKGGGNLVTIEGNTTPEQGTGSDYNGGCVAKRNRNIYSSGITAVLRPNYPNSD